MTSRLAFSLRGVRASGASPLSSGRLGLCARVPLSSAPVTTAASAASAPSVGQQVVNLATEVVRSRARIVAGGAALAAASLYYVWVTESESGVVADMCGIFEAGGVARWDEGFSNDARATVQRPGVDADLAAILRPSVVDKYAVVVGPSGAGKSTSVRKAVRSLIAEGTGAGTGAGIMYFSSGERLTTFSKSLAHATGYRTPIDLRERIRRFATGETKEQTASPPPRDEPGATWEPVSLFVKKAAIHYKEKHGVAPTLVLDAMDLVARKDPTFFGEVQDFAKACADGGFLRVVFVFSDGDALPLLLSSSAESRCDKGQVYEVGDIGADDAMQFVVSRYGRDEAFARELVATIAGGRFPLLQDYGKTSKPLDAIRAVLGIDTNTKLRAAGVRPTHPLLKAIAASTRITRDAAEELLDAPLLRQLLRLNILAVHPDGTYTFNNRHVEAHVSKALAEERRAGEAAARARRWW